AGGSVARDWSTAVSRMTKPCGMTATAEAGLSWSSWTAVDRVYSAGSSAIPPAMTVPSSATDQLSVLEALMTVWTSLPRRGPAARALTVNCWEIPKSSAEVLASSTSLMFFRLSSSDRMSVKAWVKRSTWGTTTVSSASGNRTRRLALLRREDPEEAMV